MASYLFQKLLGDTSRDELIGQLFDIDTVKFGSFILKGGMSSPVYIDFRGIISEPQLMLQVSEQLFRKAEGLQYNSVCGVPYTALPFATLISAKHGIPMLIRRKEAKEYGTKKVVEGRIKPGDVCLIVEDVVTTGTSIWETVEVLKAENVRVTDAVVLLDRDQGGSDNLRQRGINLHSVFSMSEILSTLGKLKKIDDATIEMVKSFIESTKTTKIIENPILSYADRADKCTHPISKQLFGIMNDKKTNLAFAADVPNCDELLKLANQVGPYICVLKTHVDLLTDFSLESMTRLQECARRHNFLIFEDRKFGDIGETVRGQYSGGMLEIKNWSDFVTVHSVPGPGVIEAIRQVDGSKGCVIVAEMSSAGCLTDEVYVRESVKMAEKNKDFVIGFVCQSQVSKDPSYVYFTPGVQMQSGGDSLGQKYREPRQAIVEHRCDVIIVGRGIRKAADPIAVAKQYRDAGFAAYEELLKPIVQ